MWLDVVFIVLSVIAIALGVIRVVNYDLAYRIEAGLKRRVRMRMSARTPQWEMNSRFTGILLIILGVLNFATVVSG